MISETELKSLVCQLLNEVAPGCMPEQLTIVDNIREELELDSFDFLNFLVALGQHLQIEIPESDYGKIQSLDQLLAYLHQK